MHPAILLLAAFVAVLILLGWRRRAPGSIQGANLGTVLPLAGVALLFVLGTRLPGGIAVLLSLPLLYGLWQVARKAAGGRPSTQGQTSTVETENLRMVIDHDTGDMTGDVLRGRFAGRAVEGLGVDALREVLRECAGADPQGARVIEVYLDRMHPGWRDGSEAGARGSGTELTREQALKILGLSEGASRREVVDAHRRLMQKLHPDRGGSGYLAAQVNRAKDLLLGS